MAHSLRSGLPLDRVGRFGRVGRFIRFAVVGASGVAVNQGLLMLIYGSLGWPLLLSSIIAIEAAILNNFLWSSTWIWRFDYDHSLRLILQKLAQYQAVTLFSSMVVNASVLAGLVYGLDVDYRLANLAGIAAGMGVNFLAGEFWVFRSKTPEPSESSERSVRDSQA